MRVTVDTNILISAAFWKGNEAEVIELTEKGKITLVLSKAILSEFEEVLRRKFGDMATETEIQQVVEKFISISEIVEPNIRVNIVKEDSDDNRILECAIAGNAAYVVSGDKHLLNVKRIKTIKIVTAKDFLKTIKKK